jgi:hypothetical protein
MKAAMKTERHTERPVISTWTYLSLLAWVIFVLACTDGFAALVLRPDFFH